MKEFFITKIKTQNCPRVEDIEIPLDSSARKHLIITGKNGSGKTTFLKTIGQRFQDILDKKPTLYQLQEYLEHLQNFMKSEENTLQQLDDPNISDEKKQIVSERARQKIGEYKINIAHCRQQILEAQKLQITFSDPDYIEAVSKREFVFAVFEAQRDNKPNIPTAIQNVNLDSGNTTETTKLHKRFIEYMVRLRTTYLNEKEKAERGIDGSLEKAKQIKKWFDHLEKTFQRLFERDDLRLEYFDEELNYKIIYDERCFGLNELSDGYSSLVAILTELILRMEAKGFKSYDMQGVVLIDEIETHLHLSLQKNVLPFLCKFFPKIQFIVTTHSPFVLSSLENVVICDLQNKMIISDGVIEYSYESLTDGYFDVSKYSNAIEQKVDRFGSLLQKRKMGELDKDEISELNTLENFLISVPIFQNEELKYSIQKLVEELK